MVLGATFYTIFPRFLNGGSLTFETPGDILCSIEIMTCVAIRVAIKMRSALYGQQKHDQIKMQQMMKNYYASTKSFLLFQYPLQNTNFLTVISGSEEKRREYNIYLCTVL